MHRIISDYRSRATLIGALAPIFWATVPLGAVVTQTIPPYQVVASTFWISALLTVLYWRRQGKRIAERLKLPARVWAVGIFGLFGFYLFHFIALREAPPVEAILLINLWPLCMVLFSAAIERTPLRWWHLAGVLAGFSGVLAISASHGFAFDPTHWRGYLAALACAFVWSLYASLSRAMADETPPHAIGCFCIANAVLLTITHLLTEETTALNLEQALVVLYMGIVPMCLAYYAWNQGIRNGDVRVLGGLSYAGPIVGSGLLIFFGYSEFTGAMALAGVLILGGAALSSWETLFRKERDNDRSTPSATSR